MTRIRLGWEAKTDQISVLVLFLVIGVGLVLLGSVMAWTGWLTVPMIIIGVLFLLVAALRLNGWRSLWWPCDLLTSPTGISYESRRGEAFSFPWSELAAVGAHSENGVNKRFGLNLVFFPKSADFAEHVYSPKIMRLARNGAFKVRIPRREGIAEAIGAAAPANWQRVPSAWDALVVQPGVAPQVVPAPDPRPAVIVNVGNRTRWQALAGGVLAIAASVGFMTAIFGQHGGGVAVRVIASVLGIPFILLAAGLVLSAPTVARARYFVIDADGFTWDDPSGDAFMFAWDEITSVAVQTGFSAPAPTTWAAQRRLDSVLVRTHKEHKNVKVGDQPATVEQIGAAVQQFAPRLWAGPTARTAGRFQIK